MFESPEERAELLATVKPKILEMLEVPQKKKSLVFYNDASFRIKKEAFKLLKKRLDFFIIKVDVESLKTQDLLKISKLNSDIYYIDKKKTTIYTMDNLFANWVELQSGHINSLRLME